MATEGKIHPDVIKQAQQVAFAAQMNENAGKEIKFGEAGASIDRLLGQIFNGEHNLDGKYAYSKGGNWEGAIIDTADAELKKATAYGAFVKANPNSSKGKNVLTFITEAKGKPLGIPIGKLIEAATTAPNKAAAVLYLNAAEAETVRLRKSLSDQGDIKLLDEAHDHIKKAREGVHEVEKGAALDLKDTGVMLASDEASNAALLRNHIVPKSQVI